MTLRTPLAPDPTTTPIARCMLKANRKHITKHNPNNRKSAEARLVALSIVKFGDRCCVLDGRGRRVSRWFPLKLARQAKLVQSEAAIWRIRCSQMACNMSALLGRHRREADPWRYKANTMYCGLRIRARCPNRTNTSRLRHEPRATHDWASALERMYFEAHNRVVYQSLTPWLKWARNVAKNHNRKRVETEPPTVTKQASGQLALWQDESGVYA